MNQLNFISVFKWDFDFFIGDIAEFVYRSDREYVRSVDR